MILVEGHLVDTDTSSFLENLTEIATEQECVIQSFDARYIAGKSHLTLATEYSKRAVSYTHLTLPTIYSV